MYRQMLLNDMMRREQDRIEELLAKMERRYGELPTGSLRKEDGYFYRLYDDGSGRKQVAIPDGYAGKWELIDELRERRYISAAMDKICHYAENGIRAGDELIVTWETRKRPLLFEQINACIDRYFT